MSNEELASLEPIIDDAFESLGTIHVECITRSMSQKKRKIHSLILMGLGPADPTYQAAAANDFPTCFHRSIMGPTPFRTLFTAPGSGLLGSISYVVYSISFELPYEPMI